MRRGMAMLVVAGLLGLSAACGGSTTEQTEAKGSIPQTCARIEQCDATPNQERCEQDISRDRSEASEGGCAAAIDRVLACDDQRPGSCGVNGGYDFDAACADRLVDVENCLGSGGGGAPSEECSGGGGACANPPCPNTCFVECSDFASECSGWPGDPMVCRCTSGAGAGRTFQVPDCMRIEESAAQICR